MYAHFRMVCCHLKALKILWFNGSTLLSLGKKMINSPICGDRLGKIVGEAVCAFLPGPVAVSRSWLGFEQCGVGYEGIGGTNQKYQKQSGDKQQACGENSHLDGPLKVPFQVAEQFRSSGRSGRSNLRQKHDQHGGILHCLERLCCLQTY